jgi:hypothetical protein|tara:strand:+ start:9674 stop:10342 length:669 start_codon:yes stop_codon:yes gene_type:complete
MKFSDRTLTILKSFAAINKSVIMKPGNVLKTVTPEKTLIAIANIEDTIPDHAVIYDLSRFLSILSLHQDPDIQFNDRYFTISEGSKKKTKYVYADASMVIAPPEKELSIPSEDVKVTVVWDDFQSVLKAAGVLQFEEIAFVGEDGKCFLRAIDSKNPTADAYGVEIGVTDDTFTIIVKTDNLKLLPQDYEIVLCAKGISYFKGSDVSYYVGIDAKSTYQKGE